MSIEAYLRELGQTDSPVRTSRLAELSSLSAVELIPFEKAWPGLETSRRRHIVAKLVELAEENVELNFDTIFKLCLSDADESVRTKAIDGLWECEERALIDNFIEILKGDREASVRAAAVRALGRFVLRAELGELRPPDAQKVIEVVFSVIDSGKMEPSEVRRRAIESIGSLSSNRARSVIRKAYKSDELPLRLGAVHAMGLNCDGYWLPLLLEDLKSRIPEIRYEAAAACGELEDEEAVLHLADLLYDEDIQVRVSAVMALGQIGGERAKEKLEECLGNTDGSIREATEKALETLHFGKSPLVF